MPNLLSKNIINNMPKYKVVKESKELPEGWEVGDKVRLNGNCWEIVVDRISYIISQKHLNTLIELGVVEEIKEESAGIVYIDVSDYARQLKSFGEYHKNKERCCGAYRKARITFIND